MGLSKRCKICSVLDDNNFPIGGEYCGKSLPEVIKKVCGIELYPKRIGAVLICTHCAISIIQAASTVDKLQRALNKLGKNLYSEIVAISSTASEAFKKFKAEEKNNSLNESSGTTKARVENKKEKSSVKVSVNETSVLEATTTSSDFNNLINDIENTDGNKKSSRDKVEQKNVANTSINRSINNDYIKHINENATPQNRKRKITEVESPCKSKDLDHSVEILLEQGAAVAKVRNCVLCNKTFTQKSQLKEHIESDHAGEKLKECPKCSTAFTSLQKYEAHVFKGKCLKMTSHVCEYPDCNKHFATPNKLELHMQSKHN